MKTDLKLIVALLCFYFIADTAFAQQAKNNKGAPAVQTEKAIPSRENNALFLGIWELSRPDFSLHF